MGYCSEQDCLGSEHALSVAGGTDKLVYNFSLGYYRNNSQFDVGYWDKINIRLNTEYTFNKYVKMGVDIAPRMESWEDTPDQFSSAMGMDPTTPVFKPESEWVDKSIIIINALITTRFGIRQLQSPVQTVTHAKWGQS